jgi:hypothetical protein
MHDHVIFQFEMLSSRKKIRVSKLDGFVKSLEFSFSVIPAKAGIQYFQLVMDACLRRACPCGGRGMTEKS